MQAARLRELRRRPRRGSLERPLNGRLVRTSLLVLVVPLVIASLTASRGGTIQVPPLPPSFDGDAARQLAVELARRVPSRVPGTTSDVTAARWFTETLAQYGLRTLEDTWSQYVPGLGMVELRNLAVVIPGSADGAIVFAAHRDTSGVGMGANDNATGTAALIQLARAYSSAGSTGLRPTPLHTLIFLSTDAGAWGDLGAKRFARSSDLRHDVLVAVVLDGLAGSTPRIDTSGDAGRAPAPVFVRTVVARVREQTGTAPELPSVIRQLVDLGLPFGFGDQAPLLGAHIPALRLTTGDDSGRSDALDRVANLDASRFAQLGAAAQSLLGSLDAAGELAEGTVNDLDIRGRVVRGWAVALVLISLLIPFTAGVLDLLARARRAGAPLGPAFRAVRRRLGFWLAAAGLVWFGAAVGFVPDSPARPLPPHGVVATDWPVTGLMVLIGLALLFWFVARRRLVPTQPATRADEVAGYAAALTVLGILGFAVAIAQPLALVFLVPSLYAWLWLPQVPTRAWARDVLFGLGLSGVLLVVISIGDRFALGARTPLYLLELVSVGYIPWTKVVLTAVWLAVAAQLGSICVGRYGPYSAGVARPPRGPIREAIRRSVLVAQSRRR